MVGFTLAQQQNCCGAEDMIAITELVKCEAEGKKTIKGNAQVFHLAAG